MIPIRRHREARAPANCCLKFMHKQNTKEASIIDDCSSSVNFHSKLSVTFPHNVDVNDVKVNLRSTDMLFFLNLFLAIRIHCNL